MPSSADEITPPHDDGHRFELWSIDLAPGAPALGLMAQFSDVMSEGERARAAAIIEHDARQAWAGAHIALRFILERWIGARALAVPFAISERGRPQLADGGPAFSLTHSGTMALVAVATAAHVGVDAEAVRPVRVSADRRQALINLAVRLAEGAALPDGDADADVRFAQAWTRLEAFAKADGRGIGRVLEAARRGGDGLALDRAAGSADDAALVVRDVTVPRGYVAAVAASRMPPVLTLTPWTMAHRDA
ncbi:MAG: 4'-phosphopantetheinyl transferase family protein [Hyphomicrobium sp.]